jgi:hypothetical protein
MSENTLKIIRFIIAVIGIASFVYAYTSNSILFAGIGIVAVLISLFLKRLLNQKKD